jgi:hypothetical protein
MRERKKIQNSMKSGAGADEVYVPAWIAYQHLLFLLNYVDPGDSSDTLSQHSSTHQQYLLLQHLNIVCGRMYQCLMSLRHVPLYKLLNLYRNMCPSAYKPQGFHASDLSEVHVVSVFRVKVNRMGKPS